MYANAQALVAPMSSKTAPTSQVTSAMAVTVTTCAVVMIMCLLRWNGWFGKKYSITTSRQTKHSSGRVVNMLRPKHLRPLSDLLPMQLGKYLQPRDVDHQVFRREIVENVALSLVSKGQETSHGHG